MKKAVNFEKNNYNQNIGNNWKIGKIRQLLSNKFRSASNRQSSKLFMYFASFA